MYDIPVTLESEVRGFNFYPVLSNVRKTLKTNLGGCRYSDYAGSETIQFSGKGVIGMFSRNHSTITKIQILRTDERTMKQALAALAVYVRKGWAESKAKSQRVMEAQCYDFYLKNPWSVISFTKPDWPRLL